MAVHWQRLEAEAVRDSILSRQRPFAEVRRRARSLPEHSRGSSRKDSSSSNGSHRTRRINCAAHIYTFQRRSVMLPMVEVFDGANMNESCSRRNVTTVAPQAFSLLNGELSNRDGEIPRRPSEGRQSDPKRTSKVERAFWLALGRAPSAEEREDRRIHAVATRNNSEVEVVQPERICLSGVTHAGLAQTLFVPELHRRKGWVALAEPAESRCVAGSFQSTHTQGSAFCSESEIVYFSDDAGGRQPGRYVRSETRAGEIRQHCDGLEQGEEYRSAGPLRQARLILKSPWEFKKYGRCGMDVSALYPNLAGVRR